MFPCNAKWQFEKTYETAWERKFEKESFSGANYSSSITSLDKVSDFSLDITKTYEVSSLESEEMTKRLKVILKQNMLAMNICCKMYKIIWILLL